MIDLFSEIQTRLSTEVPQLQFIDLDCQQVERQDSSYPVQFPCVLVNYSTDWQGMDIQKGNTIISFRVYQQITEDTHNSSPQKSEAFAELELVNSIHFYLQNFKGTNFSKLQRIRSEREARADAYSCTILTYTTTYTDRTAERNAAFVFVSPEVQTEIKTEFS